MSPAKNKPRSRAPYRWSFLRCQDLKLRFSTSRWTARAYRSPPPRRPAARARTAARPARARSSSAVCSRKQAATNKAVPCATKTRPATPARSRTPPPSDAAFTARLGDGVGVGRARRSCLATVRAGSGIFRTNTFPARSRSSTCITLANICGSWRRSCFPNNKSASAVGRGACRKKLDAGRIEQLVTALREIETDDPELAHPLALEADYFQRHAERMRYGEFRRQGLFVGSGVIETGCRTVIASRLKRSGMFWSVRGANAITALRCARLSNRFDDYWENRARAA